MFLNVHQFSVSKKTCVLNLMQQKIKLIKQSLFWTNWEKNDLQERDKL